MQFCKNAGICGALSLAAMVLTASVLTASPASAAGVDIGGGWHAEVMNGNVTSIVVDATDANKTVIQIAKQFDDPPQFGQFPPIEIAFTQVSPDATTVPSIVINDESIINNTGFDWTDYHWALIDSGQAWFNVPLMAGFDTAPFNNQTFSDPMNTFGGDPNKATDLAVDGGGATVPSGPPAWNPGVNGGAIWIDTSALDDPNDGPVTFNYKQFPTNTVVPEPATLVLMLAAGAMFAGRRRA